MGKYDNYYFNKYHFNTLSEPPERSEQAKAFSSKRSGGWGLFASWNSTHLFFKNYYCHSSSPFRNTS